MRSLKTILALVLFVLIAANFIFSDDQKVRVTASKANIRLRPTTQSTIVSAVPLGAVLEVIKKEGNWYFVKLPPDKKGILVTGYIHQSIVEIIEEMERIEKAEEKKAEEKKADFIVEKEKPLKIPSKPVEPPKGVSEDLDYSRWKEEYFRAEKGIDLGAKYQTIGLIAMIAGPGIWVLGEITDSTILSIIGPIAEFGGIPLWMYGGSKKARAEEKLQALEKEGRVKKYLTAYVNPQKKCYAITFTISF